MDNNLFGLIAPPVNPAMGVIGSSNGGKPVGAIDFMSLLGNFQDGSISNMASLGIDPMALADRMAGEEQMPPTEVLIPGDLAMMLGWAGNEIVSPLDQDPKTAETLVKVPVTLVTVEVDGKPELFLKAAVTDELQVSEGSLDLKQSEESTMLLPLRLRTVEQSGGRLIADAELQTATGKAVPIRLKLEIAGNLTKIGPDANGNGFHDMKGSSTVANLARNLGELNVQLISIEPADEVKKSAVAQLLPTLNKGKGNPVPKSKSGSLSDLAGLTSRSKTTVTETVLESIKADPEAAVVEKDVSQAWLAKSDSRVDRFFPVNTGNKIGLDLPTVIPAGETAGETVVLEKSDLSSVRYLDLDRKLDMLKANPGQKIKIQMTPARLGQMELTITSHRGQVTVNLTLNSLQAKTAVERNLAQLESQLASSGIKVNQFQIHINQSSRSQAGGFYHPGQGQNDGHTGHKENRPNGSFLERFQKRYGGEEMNFDRVMINCLA